MGNGTRVPLNADGIITDWAKQYFEPVPSPLSVMADPKVTFDLLALVDNSHHGSSVQQGMQKLKQFGLEFPGTVGSQATFKGPGLAGLSFLTAFRLSVADVFQYVLDCRDLTLGLGHGFVITFSPTGQRFELRVEWPNGSRGVHYQSGMSIIVSKQYVVCDVISPNRNHRLTLSDGTATAASPAGYLANVTSSPLMLGASAAGSSMPKGDIRFFGTWSNEFTAGDIATAIVLGINIMTGRGQMV